MDQHPIARSATALLLAGAALVALPRPLAAQEEPAGEEAGAAQGPGPPGCAGPEHRQFDFWVGEWDVFRPNGEQAGTNRLTAILGGCAILEEWRSVRDHAGTSLNFYDPATGRWYQTWVDNGGQPLRLAGGLDAAGRMVLSSADSSAGPNGAEPIHRIGWTPSGDGSVRQHWEISSDGGANWETAFDGRYVPREGP